MRTKSGVDSIYHVGKYALGEDIHYTLIVDGFTAWVGTDRGAMKTPHDYSWESPTTPIYFKIGTYNQDNQKSSKDGSCAEVSTFSIRHEPPLG